MDQEDFDMMPETTVHEDELGPDDATNTFDILERNYNKTIAEMEENPAYAHYLEEFTKLFEYLYATRAKNTALEEQNACIAAKLHDTSVGLDKTSAEIGRNAEIIRYLNQQVAEAHRLVDAAHAREQNAQETIDNLRHQVLAVEEELEYHTKIGSQDIGAMNTTAQLRQALQNEREQLQKTVQNLSQRLKTTLACQEELEARTSHADLQVLAISQRIDEVTEELSRYRQMRANLRATVHDQHRQLELRADETEELRTRVRATAEQLANTQAKFKEQSQAAAKAFGELALCNKKFHKLQEDRDQLSMECKELQDDNLNIRGDIQSKEVSIKRLTADLDSLRRSRDAIERKFAKVSKEPGALAAEQKELKRTVGELKKEIENAKVERNKDKQTIERYKREENALKRQCLPLTSKNEQSLAHIQTQNELKQKLDREIDSYATKQKDQSRQIVQLQLTQNRLKEELEEKAERLKETERNAIAQKSQILSYQATLTERKIELRVQETNLEAAVAQKQQSIHEVKRARADGATMHEKLRDRSFEIQMLEHDLRDKDALILQMRALATQLSQEKDAMQVALHANVADTKRLRVELRARKDAERDLRSTILASDRSMRHNAKLIVTLTNERQALSVQLMYRNDEVALLRAKVTVLQNVLHNGQAQYGQRLDDIGLLKTEIKRMRQEKVVFTNAVNNMVDMKQEVFHLERDLTRERIKSKMLLEEYQNPLNVHRWRKLEGSDPGAFQLMRKINFLQKRYLKQQALLLERDRQLKEAEKLYAHLRKMVLKQPTAETIEKCEELKRCVASNVGSMKTLRSEVDMLQVENDRYNIELAETKTELTEVRRALLEERNKRAADLKRMQSTVSTLPAPSVGSVTKFTGGGFRLCALPARAATTNARNQ